MRGNRDDPSSFDLFLDTICNTFGGIVFLAILLAVMIQNRSLVKTIDTDGAHATPEQVRQAKGYLEDAALKYERLRITLAGMPKWKPTIDDTEYRQLVDKQQQLESQIEAALQEQTLASQKLAETLQSNSIERSENDSIPKQLDEARKLVANAKSDYERFIEAKQQTLRLPRVRANQSASILVLVTKGSLYLAKTPSLFGQGFNDKQVRTSPTGSGIQIEPILGSGIDLASSTAKVEFERMVRDAKAQGHCVTIAIWPDSFGEFASLRDMMIQENAFYQLWPQSDGQVLTVYLGGGESRVQ